MNMVWSVQPKWYMFPALTKCSDGQQQLSWWHVTHFVFGCAVYYYSVLLLNKVCSIPCAGCWPIHTILHGILHLYEMESGIQECMAYLWTTENHMLRTLPQSSNQENHQEVHEVLMSVYKLEHWHQKHSMEFLEGFYNILYTYLYRKKFFFNCGIVFLRRLKNYMQQSCCKSILDGFLLELDFNCIQWNLCNF